MTTDILSDAPSLLRWLDQAVLKECSDLHLVSGYPPVLRMNGRLVPVDGEEILTAEAICDLLGPIWTSEQRARMELERNLDYAIELPMHREQCRFRVNLFRSSGSIGACIRIIHTKIPDFAWASFPESLARRIAGLSNGLVLFTGVTGSGKSTSLAMIVQMMNAEFGYRILTIEDPIEYRFPVHTQSVVTQREVGTDVESFADGLRFGLRQDPDVILVGEIRDLETARMALSAAETGHIVLSTLHTRDAKGAISRYADLFPQQSQSEIRAQLATNVRAIVCQRLLPSSVEGERQELALEIMFNTAAIGSAIRSGKLESIDNYILTGRAEGMVSMDESIRRLLASDDISRETAEQFISDRTLINR
jgi:twitching motility protein PilT